MNKLILGLAVSAVASTAMAGLTVYNAPNKDASIVKKDVQMKTLVPVVRKGNWLKVASRKNNTFGWVNLKKIRPQSETVIQNVTIISRTKDGKTETFMKQYPSGKLVKLSPKQSKALMAKLKKQQWRMDRQWESFNRQMWQMQHNMLRLMNF